MVDSRIDYGKIPPQATDLEEVLLGAMMVDPYIIDSVLDVIKSEVVFYKAAHQLVCKAILNLHTNKNKIDILTVTDQLRVNNNLEEAGGPVYITSLTARVAGGLHAIEHAIRVTNKYYKREVIRITDVARDQAYDDGIDIETILDELNKEIVAINTGISLADIETIDIHTEKSNERIEAIRSGKEAIDLIKSRYDSFDYKFGGFLPSDLIVIAGRPGMGKTALVLVMLRNIAEYCPVAIFSLEMSSIQLTNRLISSEGEFDNVHYKGTMPDSIYKDYLPANHTISKLPIIIDDDPRLNHQTFRRKARKMVMDYGVKLIAVDYIQLMQGLESKANRENVVSDISRNMKVIAKELDIPIIIISQLNRDVESRKGSDFRPKLSDLRESGAIEQDADTVILLYRPEKYDIMEDDDGSSTKGIAEVIVDKNRSGPTGSIFLRFIDYCTKFISLEGGQASTAPPKDDDILSLEIDFEKDEQAF